MDVSKMCKGGVMTKVYQSPRCVVALIVSMVVLGPCGLVAWESESPPPAETMQLVNDYWQSRHAKGGGRHPGAAVYQMGNLALYRAFCASAGTNALALEGCDRYLQHTLSWANKPNAWRLNTARKEADNQAAGQVYLELYDLCQQPTLSDALRQSCDQEPDPIKLEAISQSIDRTIIICIVNPDDRRCRGARTEEYGWSWIDAIFMSGPVFSKFGADASLPHTLGYASEDYFEALSTLYNDMKTYKYDLYDEVEQLWYRDAASIYRPEPAECPSPTTRCRTQNDRKSFWSRGNAWVIAALPRILDDAPPDAAQYLGMLREMASSLKDRQQADGFWSSSLGDPHDFPGPETSGTAGFVYAIAWGINHQVLNAADYMPVALRAWDAMVQTAVRNDGRLGYVQPAAHEPCDWMHPDQEEQNPFRDPCTWNDRDDAYVESLTDAYGVGLFLLAGSEVAQLSCVRWNSQPALPPSCATRLMQAETAEVGGGASVEFDHDGYHGGGFVNFPRSGGYVEWREVDGGPGGLTTLSFRHALRPSASRKAWLVINGVGRGLTFKSTGSWTNWLQLEVAAALAAGTANTVRIETNGQDSANIDEIAIARQAEGAEVAMGGGAQVEFNHDGYHGVGFVNFPRNGGFLMWSDVDGGESGAVTLSIRYALGVRAARTALLTINGVGQDITFDPTGAWTNWRTLQVEAQLNPGAGNVVRVESNGQDCGNIDQLFITDRTP